MNCLACINLLIKKNLLNQLTQNRKYRQKSMRIRMPFCTLNFFGFGIFLLSTQAIADTCTGLDGKTWECTNNQTVQISPVTSTLGGQAPEIKATLSLVRGTDAPITLNDFTLPVDYQPQLNDKLIIESRLANGMTQVQLSAINSKLQEGFFDKDGDPIDQVSIYENIFWITMNSQNMQSNLRTQMPVKNEFIFNNQYCGQPQSLAVEITPYTHTGEPKKGQPLTYAIRNADGSLFNLADCTFPLTESDVKLVITHTPLNSEDKNIYIDERVQSINDTKLVTPHAGDQFTASLWVADGQGWREVTKDYQSSFIWGFQSNMSDNLKEIDDKQQQESQLIWMDGKQQSANPVNTAGLDTFQMQITNQQAAVSHSYHKSEQSMSLVFNYEIQPAGDDVTDTQPPTP